MIPGKVLIDSQNSMLIYAPMRLIGNPNTTISWPHLKSFSI